LDYQLIPRFGQAIIPGCINPPNSEKTKQAKCYLKDDADFFKSIFTVFKHVVLYFYIEEQNSLLSFLNII